nr:MAG TPA: hypothetical protein [Bacteriophage sp.]
MKIASIIALKSRLSLPGSILLGSTLSVNK